MAVPNPKEIPERVSSLETAMEFIHLKIDSLDGWIKEIHQEIEGLRQEMNERFKKVDERFDKMESHIESWVRWGVGLMLTSWLTLMAAIILKH